jgi:Lhr-like helicase
MSIRARQAAVETLNSSDGALPAWAGEMYATNPAFAKTYNRFRARAQAYSDLTPAQRMIYTKSNPKWKRQIILESELERQLRARE